MASKHVDPQQSLCLAAAAEGKMTPPIGIYHRMWGAASHEQAEGVHRDLIATVLAVSSESKSPSLLVALDMCVLDEAEVDAMQALLAEQTGVPADRVVFTCSHTHGAGLMFRSREAMPGGDRIGPFLDSVHATVVELARQAIRQLRPSTFNYARGSCRLASNRDYYDSDSRQWVCGFNPEGDADDSVWVCRIVDSEGSPVATVVNYACHPTTLAWQNRLISPDFPGALREVVRQEFAGPCVFLQGASGDLGPREGFVGDPAIADRNGRQLGHAALAALLSLPEPNQRYCFDRPVVSGATIGTWKYTPLPEEVRDKQQAVAQVRHRLPLAYRKDLPTRSQAEQEQLDWLRREEEARAAGDAESAADARAEVERRTRLLARLHELPAGDSFPVQVDLWRLGDAVWIFVQGEPYNHLQRELRRRFPSTPILVTTVSGHWGASYLPPRELYGAGIYQETIAILAPGCLERMIDQISLAIQEVLELEPATSSVE